ncbi:MAG: cytochrome c family protein [Hyphomicrobiaceae bacterium]|nr:cytochrome c family protein [Hyphomicrobiaceae bacterium]
MDFFEINKIVGAGLAALVGALGVNFVGHGIFDKGEPAVPGWNIVVANSAAPAGGAAAPAAAKVAPIGERLASADEKRGADGFKKCTACHTADKGGANKTGPNLYEVVAGPKAHTAGFAYSNGLAERGAKGEKWTFADLDTFLENPKGFVAGTKMAFAGIKDPAERADVIKYLRSLAATPAPLN